MVVNFARALAAVQHVSVQPSSAILFCFVAVLNREYHNLHRPVTSSCRVRKKRWFTQVL
jgi:hypothetical protein